MLKTWKFKLVFSGVSDNSFSCCSVEQEGDTGHSSAGFLHILVPNGIIREWTKGVSLIIQWFCRFWTRGSLSDERNLSSGSWNTLHSEGCFALSPSYITWPGAGWVSSMSNCARQWWWHREKHSNCSVSEHFCWSCGPVFKQDVVLQSHCEGFTN